MFHFLTKRVMNKLSLLVIRLMQLVTKYPRLVALFGFLSGLASFFLVEREQERFAQIVSILMLASWAWLTLENLVHEGVTRFFGVKLPAPALKFLTQLVHQESLFFVIPFFVITTSWNSPQAIFTCLLFAMAIISIIDPLYYRWLARHRWLYFVYHVLTVFAVLLVVLPIVARIPTAKAYVWSLGLAILLGFLNLVKELPYAYWQRACIGLFLMMTSVVAGTLLRSWVPPANLWLTEIAIATSLDIDKRRPSKRINTVTPEELEQGLYAYTSVHAPRGLQERIYHAWYLNGRLVDKIPLDISGGRDSGYRAWSHKTNFPPYPSGAWRIDIVTQGQQLVGVLRFRVAKSENVRQELPGQVSEGTARETFSSSPERPFIRYVLDEIQELLGAMDAKWLPVAEEPQTQK